MRKTFVTGVDGFTGRYVAHALAARGHEVHGLVRQAPAKPLDGIDTVHVGDLSDEESLREILDEIRPDHVLHLAAIAFVAHGNLFEMYRTNILGTRALLAGCAALTSPPASIIVVSSANVYGNSTKGIIDEATPMAPANDYGVSKAAVEHLSAIYSDRLPITVVRPFNYTGRGQSDSFLVPKIIRHVRDRFPFIELGNLDVGRDFSDVRAVADIYCRLLETPEAIGHTLNVCSGGAVTLREIVNMALTLAGHEMELRVNPAFVRENEVKTLCGDPRAIEAVIGVVNNPPLIETLKWMLEN